MITQELKDKKEQFAQDYFNRNKREIMSFFSVIHTIVDVHPHFIYDEEEANLNRAAYFCFVSFLYCDNSVSFSSIKKIEKKKDINLADDFHEKLFQLILQEAVKHKEFYKDKTIEDIEVTLVPKKKPRKKRRKKTK